MVVTRRYVPKTHPNGRRGLNGWSCSHHTAPSHRPHGRRSRSPSAGMNLECRRRPQLASACRGAANLVCCPKIGVALCDGHGAAAEQQRNRFRSTVSRLASARWAGPGPVGGLLSAHRGIRVAASWRRLKACRAVAIAARPAGLSGWPRRALGVLGARRRRGTRARARHASACASCTASTAVCAASSCAAAPRAAPPARSA